MSLPSALMGVRTLMLLVITRPIAKIAARILLVDQQELTRRLAVGQTTVSLSGTRYWGIWTCHWVGYRAGLGVMNNVLYRACKSLTGLAKAQSTQKAFTKSVYALAIGKK